MLEKIQAVQEIVKANAKDIYKDAAQPSTRVVGKVLAQCVSLFASPVGRTAEILEKNLQNYLNKLDKIDARQITSPDPRILVPVLEKLRYTEDKKVTDYYAEILATASTKKHSKRVSIAFIEILNRLTADEIKILEYINSDNNIAEFESINKDESEKFNLSIDTKTAVIKGSIPVIDVNLISKSKIGHHKIIKNFSNISDSVKLDNPENIESYFDNMISLGIIEKPSMSNFAINKIYESLEKHDRIHRLKTNIPKEMKITFFKGRINITNMGIRLLNLCSKENKNEK